MITNNTSIVVDENVAQVRIRVNAKRSDKDLQTLGPSYTHKHESILAAYNNPSYPELPSLAVSLVRHIKASLQKEQGRPLHRNDGVQYANTEQKQKFHEIINKRTVIKSEPVANFSKSPRNKIATDFETRYKLDMSHIKAILKEKRRKLQTSSPTLRDKTARATITIKSTTNINPRTNTYDNKPCTSSSLQTVKTSPKKLMKYKVKSVCKTPLKQVRSEKASPERTTHKLFHKRLKSFQSELSMLRNAPTMFTNTNRYYAQNYSNEVRKGTARDDFLLSDLVPVYDPFVRFPSLLCRSATKVEQKKKWELFGNDFENKRASETLDRINAKLGSLKRIGYVNQ